ncbi:MAG: hypothetical protein LBT81_02030 [Helicobacteraceae bacterium]|jgi:hypothetical protein|nr:hypothetical protein [Helicobacteraceae bacterium]
MKKIVAFILFAASLYGARIEPGSVACLREAWLRDLAVFLQNKDGVSIVSYLKMERCFKMLSETVTVLQEKGEFSQIFLKGRKYWLPSFWLTD